MTTVIRYGDRLVALVKGAPEWVLEHSTHYQAGRRHGASRGPPEARAGGRRTQLRDSAGQAMRTLAFAHAVLPAETPDDEDALHARRDALESGPGLRRLRRHPRSAARRTSRTPSPSAARAGIEVKMITGDNVETARAIALRDRPGRPPRRADRHRRRRRPDQRRSSTS